MKELEFSRLKGLTLTKIEQIGNDELIFTAASGERFRLHHNQDCCESVEIESITGDLSDLIGSPILIAEESTSDENPSDQKIEPREWQDSFTWTFYKLATINGYVDIRWYGSSNGYYSESVSFSEI